MSSTALQSSPSCDAGSSGAQCASTQVASDAGVGVLSGLNAAPIVSAFLAAAVLVAAAVFAVWIVRSVARFVDLGGLVAELDSGADRRREALQRYRERSLSDSDRSGSLVDDDDREDDTEDDEEDVGQGANKRGVQGGLT